MGVMLKSILCLYIYAYILLQCICKLLEFITVTILSCMRAVGEDFTTLTGKEVIAVDFNKGGETGSVDILIKEDFRNMDRKCFTADLELQAGSLGCTLPEYNPSFTRNICITDRHTVLCSFQQREYGTYESTGHVTLKLNSSRAIPSDYEVDVDTVFGLGNASGE